MEKMTSMKSDTNLSTKYILLYQKHWMMIHHESWTQNTFHPHFYKHTFRHSIECIIINNRMHFLLVLDKKRVRIFMTQTSFLQEFLFNFIILRRNEKKNILKTGNATLNWWLKTEEWITYHIQCRYQMKEWINEWK